MFKKPNTVLEHCNYAVNSYFQKNPQQATACDFAGVATITNTDPSKNTCKYPLAGSSTSTTMTPPTTGMGTGTGTSTGTGPFVTPSTGGSITGTTGMGPTTDLSDGGARLTRTILLCSSIGLVFASLVFW
ncbi:PLASMODESMATA CALLOSE-BINDING PROTEIN 3 [Striga hermonthica]|uniref:PLASMODESMATA CALLOSE-BINDING PROTEIN 3 n=1 Tax=Striga hermonthica TaxID=68872 RepID=A0A9N7NTZ4_STRHE|nr:PLASMODESMATA CALLOSE-BINDING PROTEIN 3 [Striga hermonthica]